jgi:hypothetical protein
MSAWSDFLSELAGPGLATDGAELGQQLADPGKDGLGLKSLEFVLDALWMAHHGHDAPLDGGDVVLGQPAASGGQGDLDIEPRLRDPGEDLQHFFGGFGERHSVFLAWLLWFLADGRAGPFPDGPPPEAEAETAQ